MTYAEYSFIYPPRPERKIKPENLDTYDNGKYIAQPKYNGACAVAFMNEDSLKVMNRHNEVITNVNQQEIDFRSAYRSKGYMALCGEVLNKNQKGEDGLPFNQKFVIWDILIFESEYLVGTTLNGRLKLLDELYGSCSHMQADGTGEIKSYDHLCVTSGKGIYKAPVYTKYFYDLYHDVIKTDLYEGLVIKRAEAKLNYGFQSTNNNDWQIKCRKETKNYSF